LIEPGSLWENVASESFIGRFRAGFLNRQPLKIAPEAQLLAERWRWVYTMFMPH
jgi:putative transposase